MSHVQVYAPGKYPVEEMFDAPVEKTTDTSTASDGQSSRMNMAAVEAEVDPDVVMIDEHELQHKAQPEVKVDVQRMAQCDVQPAVEQQHVAKKKQRPKPKKRKKTTSGPTVSDVHPSLTRIADAEMGPVVDARAPSRRRRPWHKKNKVAD